MTITIKKGRIRTECVEVLHVHAIREANRKEMSWGGLILVDERQDGG